MQELFDNYKITSRHENKSHMQHIPEPVCQSPHCSLTLNPLTLLHCYLYKQPALMVPILKLQIASTKVCMANDPAAERLLIWIFTTKTYGRSCFFQPVCPLIDSETPKICENDKETMRPYLPPADAQDSDAHVTVWPAFSKAFFSVEDR